ncbi:PREDICTED: protein FAR1-RELATED SEQUENCE 6 [Nelumbo nucifera]|uniref:Protein FAR1-RELATED SEQUENCE n=1 Tax=Nelumbo nucifera TaxID=4432 RepID=A0A1U7ZNM9_NELNU|nr:PREDICTED: protein FAR1-RELATED SEQUENCE 6 [Nelumbo nucifera]XP_010250208.1 PREDICTED: protein FAR1-RELATED SEQUENCE 6 [Nelumbo nucifera]XP_010250209.1 PREDICTED: protein FAR1-RELATED SEQUENCE 6 [Nelumbo nucifera]XP_010250211.1 PREDICTED: protein FAR1-RELATED SEQUENCE 6 [Nelumbo nucifera]XP_010250212.1 PREDICTED: protein FAR1-RELATED SEQUENCE 6 [Nelumbo nucifera]XP_019052439.1 PREDICTED: protein FAR1-RELATED SEQUENCE 6 [Nelumbo nucifera]
MEEVSLNSEPVFEMEDEGGESEMEGDCTIMESDGQNGEIHGSKEPVPPAVGMEFESYDEAYKFYNCYAKELGFGVRVKNSWFKKRGKEKYIVVLCCSREGFKRERGAKRSRPETRTGCPAMIRIKLMDSTVWRVIEVRLDHNHSNSPASARFYKSHRAKRNSQLYCDSGIALDGREYENLVVDGRYLKNYADQCNRLKLKEGDAQAIYNYFSHMQLTNPSFFYLIDVSDEGCLRNVFWADARSRAAYVYFGDVVAFDTMYLTKKYDIPFVSFLGVNHHGQTVLLGCGLLANDEVESFIWLFKAWLTCMSERSPYALITDQPRNVQKAVAEVFPRTNHRLCLWNIMQKVPVKLGGLPEYEAIKSAFNKAIYKSLTVDEFETAWEDMIQRYGVGDHEWLQALYEDRQRWVPTFLKDNFFAGMSTIQPSESINSFFEGYIHKDTSLKEFLGKYELALQKNHQKEAKADYESRNSSPMLKTRCYFELQLSKVYTKEIFKKFQCEVEHVYSCFNITQVHVDRPIITYIVKERSEGEQNSWEIRDFEVLYNAAEMDVHCICGWFNFKGYLCRHALSVLNYNGVEEIPPQFILSRWRKDFKCIYVPYHDSDNIDVNNPVQRYDQLYKHALQIVEEGVISQERYKVALQVLEESLNKVRLIEDHV